MSCRCNEIPICERDIARIEGVIAENLENGRYNNELTMGKCTSLDSSLRDAVFTENFERITQRFAAINKQQDGNIENLKLKHSNELLRAQSRCERYINEDCRYHEMMAKRR